MDDENDYYNYFDDGIMKLEKQKFVIFIFINTLIDVEKRLSETKENLNDNLDKPRERLKKVLKKMFIQLKEMKSIRKC